MVGKAAGKTTGKNFGMTEAVSPVVGVMLMLVVTIVIAAVVSGFSTGIMGDKKADLPGKISFHGIAGGGTDPVLDDGFVGLLFDVEGGTVNLEDLELYISDTDYGGGEAYLTYNDPLWGAWYNGGDGANPNKLKYYLNNPSNGVLASDPNDFYSSVMKKYTNLNPDGSGMSKDTVLTTGDKFIIFMCYYTPANTKSGNPKVETNPNQADTLGFGMHRRSGSAATAWQSGAMYANGDAHYILSDRGGSVYCEGYLKATDFI